jgi:hypothetical protein
MDKEQLAWQRKIIREEYVNEQKQVSNDVTLPVESTLSKRKSGRIKRMEAKV